MSQDTSPRTPESLREGLKSLPSKINLRARLPSWQIRALFGAILLTFSEIVVWQNPVARAWYEWIALYVLYVALGGFFLDIIVRFAVVTPAAIGLACGAYGLLSGTIINHAAFANPPYGLVIRTLGLQVGAGFLALMLFLIVMRGKPPEAIHIGGALLVGLAWGIWANWYPQQINVGWGSLTAAQAQTLLVVPLFLLAAGFAFLVPHFGALRESTFTLTWWEAIICGIPLFVALMLGVATRAIPFFSLALPALLLAYCLWSLDQQLPEQTPSILAELTFSAPNLTTYVILTSALVVAGSLAYTAVPNADSPLGAGLYLLVAGFGLAWLPFASLLLFWSIIRAGGFRRRKK